MTHIVSIFTTTKAARKRVLLISPGSRDGVANEPNAREHDVIRQQGRKSQDVIDGLVCGAGEIFF